MKTPDKIALENARKMDGRHAVYKNVRAIMRDGENVRAYLRDIVEDSRDSRGAFHQGALAEARAQAKAMGIRL